LSPSYRLRELLAPLSMPIYLIPGQVGGLLRAERLGVGQ
jgi:hypothetical protein